MTTPRQVNPSTASSMAPTSYLHPLLLNDPVLRLSYNNVLYVQALKTNGSGEFEEALRAVVKCIYSPSKYYSKVIQTVDSQYH